MVYLNDMPYDCDLMIGDNGELHLFSCYTHSDTFGYEHDDWVKIDNVMQYTGLCDKNDTKIFMKCIEFATKRG